MLKVLILAETPEIVASARVNAYQYVTYLRELGVELDIMPPYNSRTYEWLNLSTNNGKQGQLLRRILGRYYAYIVVPYARIRQIIASKHYDLVIIQRNLWRHRSRPIFERLLRKVHSCLVYQLDDALFVYDPYVLEKIKLADAIWTGNEYTASQIRQFNQYVRVIETGVDVDTYYHPKTNYNTSLPIVIGWVGTQFNFRHLTLIEDAIYLLSKKYNFTFRVISSSTYQFSNRDIATDFVKWSLQNEVHNLLSIDIGIMPLLNDEYSRGKEGFKIKQYMACAIPVVASPVGYNARLITDNTNGYLASTTEEWVTKLSYLIEDPQKRKILGQAGYKTVIEQYSTRKTATQLVNFFRDTVKKCHKST